MAIKVGMVSLGCPKNQVDAEIAIKDGWNFVIAEIDLGDRESSNAFAKELVRRWNEFPEELKQ